MTIGPSHSPGIRGYSGVMPVAAARMLIAQGRPRAAARRLLALAEHDPQARALLESLPAAGAHGAVLAERLRFGPPETWCGWRAGHGRVAVKLWPAAQSARMLPPLGHPGVAPLVDQGAGWRVFGWVAGATLANARRRGPLPADLIKQVGAAVAALHAGGVAHGDLTPANVVITPHSRAVLIDWGEDSAGTPGWRPEGPHDAHQRDHFALAALSAFLREGERP